MNSVPFLPLPPPDQSILRPNSSFSRRMVPVLVSCGCYKISPQTWWLKTREMYYLLFWIPEACNQYSWAHSQGSVGAVLPLEALGKGLSLPPSVADDRPSLACDHITPTSVPAATLSSPLLCHICLCLHLSRHLQLELGPT